MQKKFKHFFVPVLKWSMNILQDLNIEACRMKCRLVLTLPTLPISISPLTLVKAKDSGNALLKAFAHI